MKMFEQFPFGRIDAVGAPVVRAIWDRQPAWAVASISEMDAAFFAGMVIETRPTRLVEIGVASGWGSCILLHALSVAGIDNAEIVGIDIAPRFFYDEAYATGQCVTDVMPAQLDRYRLITGATAGESATRIGGAIDFAFIDAHHMHPWATLDLLAVLPSMRPGSWVAMHDLSLSLKADQEHHNRGPKYLFEGWDGDKMHSIQRPTMAGAIKLPEDLSSSLPLLLDILYTPWELPVENRAADAVCATIGRTYGDAWQRKFARAVELGNYLVHKMHSSEPQAGRPSVGGLRTRAARVARRLFGERSR
jgi:predicted O-methyltransferase YrrM